MSDKSKAKSQRVYADDQAFYVEIWVERKHVCGECGTGLGPLMSRYFMAHILSKGAYNAFRHDSRNIILLCTDHHNMLDGKVEGKTKDDLRIAPYLERIRMELKLEYHGGK